MADRFPFIYRAAVAVCGAFIKRKGRLTGFHLERVPTNTGLIVAAIHMSHLDPPAMACTIRNRRLRALAKEELWKNKLFGKVIEGIGAFPVKRGEGDVESIRKCIQILKDGEAVIIFPEGTRNDGVKLLPFNAGVAMIAKKSGVPVLPVGISGTQLIMPRGGKKGISHPVNVCVGQPFTYAEIAEEVGERAARAELLSRLEQQIIALTAEAGLNILPSTPPSELPS